MLGKLLGLLGGYMILLQFFFMGRLPFLERVFGLDTLSRYHQRNGRWGIVLILLHPVFLTLGYASLADVGLWAQFLDFLSNYEDVSKALVGLVLFSTVVATSLVLVRSRLKYEFWYLVHLLAYLAVFFSYQHQFKVGSDLLASRFFYGYWTVLYILVFGAHLLFRCIRPLYLSTRHDFVVSRVVRETPTTVSVYISGNRLRDFGVQPGQFMIFRFLSKGFWWQAHPFSLSRPNNGEEIRITVKELGDFTREIRNLQPGTRVVIDGPYGVFTKKVAHSAKILLIGGGIGITPLRSLAEQFAGEGRDVTLLYANRSLGDIPLRHELEAISGLKLANILSDEPNFSGEKGRIDEEKIRRLVPDFKERDIYICGPVPMMEGLITTLKGMGVPSGQIHYEKFAF